MNARKIKAILSLALAVVVSLGATTTATATSIFDAQATAATITAIPTPSKVYIDNKLTSFDAYNINGYNYFKIRDVAYALDGSPKNFDVKWYPESKVIGLNAGKAYTPEGGEMSKGDGKTKQATLTTSKMDKDYREVNYEAYNIGGYNYFKLRDIAASFDFYLGWNEAESVITIDTSKIYQTETGEETLIGDVTFRPSLDLFIDSTYGEKMTRAAQDRFIESLLQHSKGITNITAAGNIDYDFTLVPLPAGYTWEVAIGWNSAGAKMKEGVRYNYKEGATVGDKFAGTINSPEGLKAVNFTACVQGPNGAPDFVAIQYQLTDGYAGIVYSDAAKVDHWVDMVFPNR